MIEEALARAGIGARDVQYAPGEALRSRMEARPPGSGTRRQVRADPRGARQDEKRQTQSDAERTGHGNADQAQETGPGWGLRVPWVTTARRA